jgi:hypothetical protein
MIRREVAPEIVDVDAGDTRFAKLGCVGGGGGEGRGCDGVVRGGSHAMVARVVRR